MSHKRVRLKCMDLSKLNEGDSLYASWKGTRALSWSSITSEVMKFNRERLRFEGMNLGKIHCECFLLACWPSEELRKPDEYYSGLTLSIHL